jgi:hypothetical protein
VTAVPHAARRNFEQALATVIAGGGVITGGGLDTETEQTLWSIADAYPDVSADLVEVARRTFEAQLDGSHAAARLKDLAAEIDRINGRR